MHVGVIVDHPKRDLPGAVMLAHAAAARGTRLSIVPLYEQAVDVPLLGLDAVIVNYARPINRALIEAYAAMGIAVVVLDTEGGVMAEQGANSPRQLAAYMRDSGYAPLLSAYCFWGSRLRDAFADANALPVERMFVTGCPRFDVAAPRWSRVLDYPRDDFVLVNANFPLVNPRFAGSIEHERATMVSTGWPADYVDALIAELTDVHRRYVDAVVQIAQRRADTSFVVRPHPFENIGVYEQAFGGLSNVVVDGSGSVLNVIRHARCILHLNCGTAVEATMLRKLPVALEFLNSERLLQHSSLPSSVSWHARSVEDAADALGNVPSVAEQFDFERRHAEYVRPWFHDSDGFAAERVLDAVSAALSARPPRGPQRRLRWSLSASRAHPRPLQRAQAWLGNALGSRRVARLRTLLSPKRAEKRIDAPAVQSLIDRLALVSSRPAAAVAHARHPLTGVSLASLTVEPR